ncbi:FAS1-like dehydratase domain-containing protein [Methylobacterium symbioticum]|uniref:Mesaconyl-C(4)-CoA hydratase n=1 Tax=Methylobacterium symbioticum TaxID=2584084 RepID=A0A509EG34_9HYPH|nr:MaoC family dehydratase N-terminal domain-containing protein [Methylobacterium symbioticum]VUD72604.1 Mesaconyl-C(4)-CoA hydratase [Methylobacterium symbioticum]
MDATPLDIDHLRGWIGRTETAEDDLSEQLVRGFRATLDQDPGKPRPGEAAPLAIHWCLSPAIRPMRELGPDGHPARGGFLPPVPLPRRMWAGGEIRHVDPLRVGDRVRRVSRIGDVQVKHGRTGPLCFVAVHHDFETERGLALSERHDIVYREMTPGRTGQPPEAAGGVPAAQASHAVDPTPTLLFRYSALTFNGHRIHYDRAYATEVEGYPGLVVHGPLQATWLLHLAAGLRGGAAPGLFRFRGLSPVFDGAPLTIAGRLTDGTTGEAWTLTADGRVGMQAQFSDEVPDA